MVISTHMWASWINKKVSYFVDIQVILRCDKISVSLILEYYFYNWADWDKMLALFYVSIRMSCGVDCFVLEISFSAHDTRFHLFLQRMEFWAKSTLRRLIDGRRISKRKN